VGCPRACCARPERKKTTARKCSSGAENWTLEVAEQHVSVDVVLLRARGRRLRLWGEHSTAARRWRPEESRGRRGVRVRSHQGRGKRPEWRGDDAWMCAAAGGGAREAVPAVNGGDRSRAEGGSGAVRGGRSRLESEGLVCDFQKFQGPFCKLRFTIDRKS
jgi:hypothetical protein